METESGVQIRGIIGIAIPITVIYAVKVAHDLAMKWLDIKLVLAREEIRRREREHELALHDRGIAPAMSRRQSSSSLNYLDEIVVGPAVQPHSMVASAQSSHLPQAQPQAQSSAQSPQISSSRDTVNTRIVDNYQKK